MVSAAEQLAANLNFSALAKAQELKARSAMLDRLASMFRTRGYRFVSLDRALEDPAYRHPDGYYGPAGITWLQRWAITDGKPVTVFAGEPTVPKWIEQASR